MACDGKNKEGTAKDEGTNAPGCPCDKGTGKKEHHKSKK